MSLSRTLRRKHDRSRRDLPIVCKSTSELHAALASGRLQGRAVHVVIMHDDNCTPSCCRCSPEFRIEELTTDNYLAGQRAEREWMLGAR